MFFLEVLYVFFGGLICFLSEVFICFFLKFDMFFLKVFMSFQMAYIISSLLMSVIRVIQSSHLLAP